MKLHLIFYNTFKGRRSFELSQGSRNWNIFLMITDGSFTCEINGRNYVIEKNEIAFFPQNIAFNRRILDDIDFHQFGFVMEGKDDYFSYMREGKLNVPKKYVEILNESLELTSRLMKDNKMELYRHFAENIITENYIHSFTDYYPGNTHDDDISFVIQYLTKHLGDKINLDEIAAKRHLTQAGLIWKFKRGMGCTPHEFLIGLRMRYAKQLVLEGKIRINEIARLCGYSNPYYFSTAFSKIYGASPSKFKEMVTKY